MTAQRTNDGIRARPAFTLLEMILAASIAVVLLAALYVAVDLQLRHASSARDVVEQTTLARTLLNRIASNITPGITTADPTRYQQSGQSGGSGGGTSGGSSAKTTQGGTTGGAAGATPSANTASSSNSGNTQGTVATTTTNTVGSFTPASTPGTATSSPNGLAVLALQGDSTTLTLYLSRVPANPNSSQSPNQNQTDQTQLPGVSDMRRIYYWLDSEGLCRQEINPVTSEDAMNGNVPSGSPDPSTKQLLAREVRSLQFRYFDGTDWNDTWDGTQTGSDNVTPIGPPVLVEITIGLALPDSNEVKTYRHVVSIPTANGVNAQQQTNSSDGTGTTGNNSSSGTGSGSGTGTNP